MPDLIKAISEAGSLGILVLLLLLLTRYGSRFLDRLLDHLDAGIQAQNELANRLIELSDQLNAYSDQAKLETAATAKLLADISRQLQTHESRAQRRHEQAIAQSEERHAELIGVLRQLNGKAKQ